MIFRDLNRNLPETTDVGAAVIAAVAVPGGRDVLVIANQHDGKFCVEMLRPGRDAAATFTWGSVSHAYDLSLEEALDQLKRRIASAYSVAVSLSS